jgi:hypothetical protein
VGVGDSDGLELRSKLSFSNERGLEFKDGIIMFDAINHPLVVLGCV